MPRVLQLVKQQTQKAKPCLSDCKPGSTLGFQGLEREPWSWGKRGLRSSADSPSQRVRRQGHKSAGWDGVGGVAQVQVAREREALSARLLVGTRNLGQVFLSLSVYSTHLQVRNLQLRAVL